MLTIDQEGRVIETKMIMMEESKNVKQKQNKNKNFATNWLCIPWNVFLFILFRFFAGFRLCILIANECDRDFDTILILSGMLSKTGSLSFGNSSTFLCN